MNWIARPHPLSFVLLLAVPGLAFAVVTVPEDDEIEVSADELPAAIKAALKNVVIDEAERNAASAVYEIDITANGIEIELQLDPNGRLLGIEIEDEGADDDDDEDGDDDEGDDEPDDEDGDNDENIVDIRSVPAAAQSALKKFAGDNTIVSVERGEENGHVVFEALWKVGGTEHEATVTAAGVLVELEESTTADVLPESVRKQSDRHFPNSGNLKFERKLIAAWEIEGTINGRERELLVTSTGSLIEFEDDEN